jgi:hypothetical protein
MLGGGELDLARQRFGWETGTRFPWEQSEAAAQRKLQAAGMKQQAQASRRGFWGSLGSAGLGALGSIFSDIRLKENVKPLTALRKLPLYEWDYNEKAEELAGEHGAGVIAQDLEKVLPEAVTEVDLPKQKGAKMVNLYSLLAMTMSAVKELDKKINKKVK